MPVVKGYEEYFGIIKEYNSAPEWQKDLMLRGTIRSKCSEAKSHITRSRLQRFWTKEVEKRGLNTKELQTQV